MKLAATFLVVFASAPSQTQTADARPVFDVVSITPSPEPIRFIRSNGGPGTKDPGLYTCENCSLVSLVSSAYDIPQYRTTAPDWMQNAHFVVNAKIPAGTTKDQFGAMMQNMLADRFKLAVHRDQKEMAFYEMVVAKGGPKFKEPVEEPVKPPEDPEARPAASKERSKIGPDGYPTLPEGYSQSMIGNRARIGYHRQTMAFFADVLSYQVHEPVHDATGLTGKYDFGLLWASGVAARPAGADAGAGEASDPGVTIFEALQSQLGLRLDHKKGPIEILVVDHAEKLPTAN